MQGSRTAQAQAGGAGVTRLLGRFGRRPATVGLLAGLAAFGALLASPARGEAGVYRVIQCDAAGSELNYFAWDAASGGSDLYADSNRDCSDEGDNDAVKLRSLTSAPAGARKVWRWAAPRGSLLRQVEIKVRSRRAGGHAPRVYVGNRDGSNRSGLSSGTTDGWTSRSWSGAREALFVEMICTASDRCRDRVAFNWVRDIQMVVEDRSAPRVSLDAGSLTDPGWLQGSGDVSVTAADRGSGVRRIRLVVNGQVVERRSYQPCSPTYPRSSALFRSRLRPCGTDNTIASPDLEPRSETLSADTTQAPFVEGPNAVEVCADDLATGNSRPNVTCTELEVLVDNLAPSAPGSLSVVGGSDWRAENDFAVGWQNPPQAGSPIVAARYRITGPGNYDSGVQRREEAGVDALTHLSIPAPGEYTLSVWLEDAAGNASGATASHVPLRFDDTVPIQSIANVLNGWISRLEFPYRQWWTRSSGTVSGIAGYAVVVDRSDIADPCVTAADPDPGCAEAEITFPGRDNVETLLRAANFGEGEHFVHVAAASNSGVRQGSVDHTRVRVDRTDPATAIAGVPGGWANAPVEVTVTATDELSGMAMTESDTDEAQPRTALRVGRGPVVSAAGPELRHEIGAEGVHTVAYWARDLAGNESDGRSDPYGNGGRNNPPDEARVRIDLTAPRVAFADAEDPEDPGLVQAPAADELSGLEGGAIRIRRTGEVAWRELPAAIGPEGLEARVPDDLEPGEYELQAEARDRAGNVAVSGRRADGSLMLIEAPLAEPTRLLAALGSGRKAIRVGYGRGARLRGRLRTRDGDPVAGAELRVLEAFAAGSRPRRTVSTVGTDAEGRFAAVLSPGPSRAIRVAYAGSDRYAPAGSRRLRMAVRGRVLRFRAPRRVREGGTIAFRGRIGVLGTDPARVGKRIEIQYRKGGRRWETISSGRAAGSGRFRLGYGLRADYLRRTRVVFRVLMPRERGWPYGAAASRPRRVTIVPR